MKCKNCGANYRTRELKCPYCGTENVIGRIWLIEREEADRELVQAKRQGGARNVLYVADKVMNRILMVSTTLFVLLIAIAAIVFTAEAYLQKIYKKVNLSSRMEQTMQEYYENWEFTKLYDYMDKYDLFSQEYYAYSQVCFMQFDYDMYKNDILTFLCVPDDEKEERRFLLENAIKFAARTYNVDAGIYSEQAEENEKIYAYFRQEMEAFWYGMLGMTEEEVAMILDEDFSFYGAEYTALVDEILERRAWE